MINDIAVANGLAFSPDGRTLYAADSPRRSVQAYDLDPISGAVSNPRAFVSLAPGDGHIDGATVDAEGGYWLAVVGVGELRRYHRDGRLDRAVGLPCSNPTKAAFGGETFATLFVTSTKLTINPHADASKNGAVFSFEPGERGVPDALFASN